MFSNNQYRSIQSDYKSLVLTVIKLPKLTFEQNLLFIDVVFYKKNSINRIKVMYCLFNHVRVRSLEHVPKNYYTMVSVIASIDTMKRLKLENLSIVMQ